MNISETKQNLIVAICREIQRDNAREKESHNLSTFVHHFFKRAPIEFLQKMSLAELTYIVEEAWSLFQVRQAHESLVKIKEYKLSHHVTARLGILMVNLDQPFLIDSITTFLDKKGFKTEVMVHPVLGVHRAPGGHLTSLVDLKEIHPSVEAGQQNGAKRGDSQQYGSSKPTPERGEEQPESIIFIQIKSTLKSKQIQALQKELDQLLTQVRNVVLDWPLIQAHAQAAINHISKLPVARYLPSLEERHQLRDFLTWLEQGHFVFLGARYFSVKSQENQKINSSIVCLAENSDTPHLGLFRDEAFLNGDDLVPAFSRARLIAHKSWDDKWPTLSITKTNTRSTVHRASRIDSVEVIDWDSKGKPQGLYQFIGVFTKKAFTGSAFETPIVSQKVQNVFNRFGLAPQWHDGKTLITILNSIPRDELFYLSDEQIYEVSQSVLNMNDQHSLTLLIRPDVYGRYITVMIYLPREKYSFALKGRFYKILEQHLKGKITSDNVLLGELDYARLIFVLSFSEPCLVAYNQIKLENDLLEAALNWEDHLERIINRHYDEENAATLFARYQKAFPTAYIDEFGPDQAVVDISYIEKINDAFPIDLYLYKEKDHKGLKVKIFHARHALSLSTLLPILQNLGLQVIGETSYQVEKDEFLVWVHDFEVEAVGIENWKTNHQNLISAFHHIWNGTAENDILHQLILKAGLNVRQVTLVRAYLKFLHQAQLPYSLGYPEEVLSHYPDLTRHFVEFFELRFALKRSKTNACEQEKLRKDIDILLDQVERLDHDRILRRFLNAIEATVRTNYFQRNPTGSYKPYLSFKFEGRKIDELPLPIPLYGIFVYSARFEAIHLRGAKVARGGIRWSDRSEDFYTEVLGLMKAQTVKNSVIVPLGSKGGFVVKKAERFADSAQLMNEVIGCYQMMMRGMLDITDNWVNNKIVPPSQVVRFDEDDPYLVVAADKGTATFSDIANAISVEYGFWLDDAFASGGSAGYDHKKMGITARGAWESVKRHFRECKQDTQTTPFTVVGVGDMGGDVFGNGMLQSRKIRLLAAFNHDHIFLDPDPDMETSFHERKRLFHTPQSSWRDYNPQFISKGGGVFDRQSKLIKISPQVRKAFNLHHTEITPDDLIRHLLCLPVDLLYFGGIGTFVKASSETHGDVGDRANNDIRVDAQMVRAKVIGEGANLAMTQRARVEFALKGGRLNTDAIDNSAGVDCSDHEVNLKILFRTLGQTISRNERNDLLKEMTDDVAQLVLADNYRQTQILTVLESVKAMGLNTYQSLMRILESEVGLDRVLEALPDDEALERRRTRNQGMTRPELSVLLAYAKIALYEKILASPLPDDPNYRIWLQGYFPSLIQKQFSKAIDAHPLRREITATVLANELINRVGPTFIYEISQTCGATDVDIVKAFFLACDVLDLQKLWGQIDSLDGAMIADVQTHSLLDIIQTLEQVVLWFLRHPDAEPAHFTGLQALLSQVPEWLQGEQHHLYEGRKQNFLHIGVLPSIAHDLSVIPFFPAILNIMFLCRNHRNRSVIAQAYFTLRSKIGLDWLMMHVMQIQGESDWQRSARTSLMDDLTKIQAKLTASVMEENVDGDVEAWMQKHKNHIQRVRPLLANIKTAGHTDLGILSYAVRQLERLGE